MLTRTLCAAALLLPVVRAQADIIVGPGGYLTLNDALRAARDGDRILLRGDCTLSANRHGPSFQPTGSITIQSDPSGPRRWIQLSDWYDEPDSLVLAMQGEIVIRNVEFVPVTRDWGGNGFTTTVTLSGSSVKLIDVFMGPSQLSITDSHQYSLLTITAQQALLDRVTIDAQYGQFPVSGFPFHLTATDAARIQATELIVATDCQFFGSHAPDGIDIDTSRGGIGLVASAPDVALTRCSISDGNGGIATMQWATPPIVTYTDPGVSVLSGELTVAQSIWTQGVPGGSTSTRPTVAMGRREALISVGSASPGGSLMITVAGSSTWWDDSALGFFVGLRSAGLSTPFGRLLVMPEVGFTTSRPFGSAAVAFRIPNDATVIGTIVLAQTVLNGPSLGAVAWGAVLP